MTARHGAAVLSEVFGPAPLLVVAYLAVGAYSSTLLLAAAVVTCMAVMPYAFTALLAHRGRVSDRFVSNRAQRVPVLIGTLACVVVGLAILMLAPGNTHGLIVMTVVMLSALIAVTIVSLKWKISIHATIASFVTGILVVLFGPFLLPVAVAICGSTCWARFRLSQHSVAQLLAGLVVGFVMATSFGVLL
ncbi:acidPPc domain-containing protein (plasmid) [Agreia sp. COWG]|nr:acidPPc domain-containing protein [Agreia sp. COWG]